MEELIGKRFKRNKYGLSLWEDRIKSIRIDHEFVVPLDFKTAIRARKEEEKIGEAMRKHHSECKSFGFVPKLMIQGERGNWFESDEIVIYYED